MAKKVTNLHKVRKARGIRYINNLKNFSALQGEVGLVFSRNGWNNKWGSAMEMLFSAVGDIVSATACWGNGLPGLYRETKDGGIVTPGAPSWANGGPVKGPMAYLASAILKIMNVCHLCQWDLQKAIIAKHKDNTHNGPSAPQI